MNHSILSLYVCLLLSCVVWCGCQPSNTPKRRTVPTQDILAQVGEHVITKKDLETALMQMSPYMRTQYNSLEQRKQLLLQMVEFEVLYHEAKKQKMEQTEEIQHLRKRIMAQTLLNRVVQQVRPVDISESELRSHWTKHRTLFPQSFVEERDAVLRALLQQKQTVVYRNFLATLRNRYPVQVNDVWLRGVPTLQPKVKPKASSAIPAKSEVSASAKTSQPVSSVVPSPSASAPIGFGSTAPTRRATSLPTTSSWPQPPTIQDIPSSQPQKLR